MERLGRDWLDEVDVALVSDTLQLGAARPLHGPEIVSRDGCYSPASGDTATLARPSYAYLVGDDSADYAVGSNPIEAATRGYGLFMADVWVGGDLISPELLNPTAIDWCPTAERLAFIAYGGPEQRIVVTIADLATGARVRYGPWQEGEEDLIAWSPDGQEVWLVGIDDPDGRPSVLDVVVGTVRTTALPGGSQGVAWSADGCALAVTHAGGLMVVTADGSRTDYDTGPGWMPVWVGGNHIVFGAREDLSLNGDDGWSLDVLRVLRVADGHVETLLGSYPVQPGLYVQSRPCGTDEPRTAPPRWWEALLLDGARIAPRLPTVIEADDGRRLIRDEKLRLTYGVWPALYERYAREFT